MIIVIEEEGCAEDFFSTVDYTFETFLGDYRVIKGFSVQIVATRVRNGLC